MKQPLTTTLIPDNATGQHRILVELKVSTGGSPIVGGLCPDRFHGAEATVACRSANLGFAQSYTKVFLSSLLQSYHLFDKKNCPQIFLLAFFIFELCLSTAILYLQIIFD